MLILISLKAIEKIPYPLCEVSIAMLKSNFSKRMTLKQCYCHSEPVEEFVLFNLTNVRRGKD